MSTPKALANEEVAYLCAMLHGHFETIRAAKAQVELGSGSWERAVVAESAVGWLLGWLQGEVHDRGMVSDIVLGDIDAALEQILDEGDAGEVS